MKHLNLFHIRFRKHRCGCRSLKNQLRDIYDPTDVIDYSEEILFNIMDYERPV